VVEGTPTVEIDFSIFKAAKLRKVRLVITGGINHYRNF
jgi:hypothetical protein